MLAQDVRLRTGRPVLVLEVAQPSPSSTSKDVAELAAQVHAPANYALLPIHTASARRYGSTIACAKEGTEP